MMTASRSMNRNVTQISRSNGASFVSSKEPLTLDAIRIAAPSVFAEDKHASRSNRYTYIPTVQVVEHLMSKGYGVFAVSQSGSRDEDKRGHTKHMIRFRDLNQTIDTVGQTFFEQVLTNAHDGTSAWRFMAGIYRLACSNGLIVSESSIADIRIKHSGNVLEEVAQGVARLGYEMPKLAGSIQEMQQLRLTNDEQRVFAQAALTLKHGEEPPIKPETALQVRRSQDAEPTLWNTLNRVQEALIRGGDRYVRRGEDKYGRPTIQRRKTNAVNSVSGLTGINRALWTLAEEMKKIKTA